MLSHFDAGKVICKVFDSVGWEYVYDKKRKMWYALNRQFDNDLEINNDFILVDECHGVQRTYFVGETKSAWVGLAEAGWQINGSY